MPLLEAAGIGKIFGKLTALDGAALTVGENEFHGLIGPNGSGKSTLMKCIAGAEVPTKGKVSFINTDITAFTPTERARAGMSLKFQITSVLPTLTLYDNILLALQGHCSLLDLVFSRSRRQLHDQVMMMLTQFRLADRAFDAAAALSWSATMAGDCDGARGQAPAPAFGRAHRRHESGGAPRHRRTLATNQEHCSLVIVEHDLDFIRDICDRLTVLDQGKVLATGSVAEIQANKRVQEIYLRRA